MRKPATGGLVYSTDSGRMCPTCRSPILACTCKQARRAKGDGNVKVTLESKGRGGKSVTVVKGMPLEDKELEATAKRMRAACGAGGTVKDGVIEIQGDHRERIAAWLQAEALKASAP